MTYDVGGSTNPNFSAIDPVLLPRTVVAAEQEASQLEEAANRLSQHCQSLCVSTTALSQALEIANWAREQLPMLRRRANLAAAMGGAGITAPGSSVVLYEPLPWETDEAKAAGRALAARLLDIHSVEAEGAAALHQLATELAANRDDPDFLMAFYAAIPPEIVQILPHRILGSRAETAAGDLEEFSRAFGTAASAPNKSSEFAALVELWTQPPPSPAEAWGRGAMLAFGRFPAAWLAKVAKANALDSFADDMEQEFRGGSAYGGLPDDTVALYLHVLGHNPEAARIALHDLGQQTHLDLPASMGAILTYSDRVGTGGETAQALGEALAAATGASSETTGLHSPEAAAVAFTVLTTLAKANKVPLEMKGSIAEIAASYAPEFAIAGAMSQNAIFQSSLGMPVNAHAIPGINPAFYLSGRDMYGVLKTFADDPSYTDAFDEATGVAFTKAMAAAVVVDQTTNRGRVDAVERTAYAFGIVAGAEFQAAQVVRGNLDADDARFRSAVVTIATLGLGKLAPTTATMPAKAAWQVFKFAFKSGLKQFKNDSPDRVGTLEAAEKQRVMAGRYVMVSKLLAGGWPAGAMPGSLRTASGELRPLTEISADDVLTRDWYTWLESHADDSTTIGGASAGAAGQFTGGERFGDVSNE